MSSKVFNSGNDAKLEASWNDFELTDSQLNCNVIVNPGKRFSSCIGKTVILTLLGQDLSRLLGARIISRFKLNTQLKYEYSPYRPPINKINIESKKYSRRILNRYLMKSSEEIKDDEFLLGTELTSGNDVTQIGYIIYKTITT